MELCIGNYYYTETRKFQSIVFGIDSNSVHMEYQGLFFFLMQSVTLFFMIMVPRVKMFDANCF